MLFYLNLPGKKFCWRITRSKNFKQKLRYQVVETEALTLRVESEAIQKLPFPHPWYKGFEDYSR